MVTRGLLIVAGIIHLLPLAGLSGPRRLAAMYGIAEPDGELALLLRHRSVLFGLLGLLLVIGAFDATLRRAALVSGLISAVSFLALAGRGPHAPAMRRVLIADLVAVLCLVGVAAMELVQPHFTAGHNRSALAPSLFPR